MITNELERIQASNERIKTNIANAYNKAEKKGATLPKVLNSENLVSAIDSIDTGKWRPQPDWWDIETILENDVEDYAGKSIILLRGIEETTAIPRLNANKIVTSDGVEYDTTSTSYNHTWNTEYDKECSLGYKTRYIIYYHSNNTNIPYNTYIPKSSLYAVLKDYNITTNFNSFSNAYILESVKFINTGIRGQYFFLNNNYSLRKVTGFIRSQPNLEGSGTGMFQEDVMLKEIDFKISDGLSDISLRQTFLGCNSLTRLDFSNFNIDVSKVRSWWNTIPRRVQYIERIDFTSVDTSNLNNMVFCFSHANSLIEIGHIGTILFSGLNFNNCPLINYSTLIRILEALADHSLDTENTYTLTLGSVNLAKLTDEELAIGQNKGWTIS